MPHAFRSDCPVTSAVDVLGDKWMLVIIKQILLDGKRTFKDFVEADEAIATNILSAKLKILIEFGLVRKVHHPTNKKTRLYQLTEEGLALTPLIIEMVLWSDQYLREANPLMRADKALAYIKADKGGFIQALQQQYRESIASFAQGE